MKKPYRIRHLSDKAAAQPKSIVQFYRAECQRAARAGSDDPEWRILEGLCTLTEEALQGQEQAAALYGMFRIGESAALLASVRNWMLDGMLPGSLGDPRMAGLSRENRSRQRTIAHAQRLARDRWRIQSEKRIRVAEMCAIVWGEMCDSPQWRDSLPNDANGLRRSLSKVAPAYAKAPGRSRKS